jgi:hypothetical protein
VFTRALHWSLSWARLIHSTPSHSNGIIAEFVWRLWKFLLHLLCLSVSILEQVSLLCHGKLTLLVSLVLQRKRKDTINRREIGMVHKLFREKTRKTVIVHRIHPLSSDRLRARKMAKRKMLLTRCNERNSSRSSTNSVYKLTSLFC